MARLIDANVVLANKFTTGLSDASGNYYGNADVVFADDIENAPTVDAVIVVRCRDCKYGMHFGDPEDEWINCKNLHGEPLMPFDGFCSYGERMEGAD